MSYHKVTQSYHRVTEVLPQGHRGLTTKSPKSYHKVTEAVEVHGRAECGWQLHYTQGQSCDLVHQRGQGRDYLDDAVLISLHDGLALHGARSQASRVANAITNQPVHLPFCLRFSEVRRPGRIPQSLVLCTSLHHKIKSSMQNGHSSSLNRTYEHSRHLVFRLQC